jgi:LacI family transcriptional regulator
VTIKEVAEAAGVSMMTVSNVIHNRPNVGEASRRRVLSKIKSLGYVPNRAAQELAGVAHGRFGLLYSSARNQFAGSLFAGSLAAAVRLRADISIQLAEPGDPAAFRRSLKRMVDSGIEGLLLPSPIAEFAAETYAGKHLPVPAVAIATGHPLAGMSSVRSDERQAAFEIVSMLLELGHTKIAYLSGPDSQSGCIARREGYFAALKARGLSPRPELQARSIFRFQEGLQAADALLQREPRITAVFAANDTLAASVIAAAHRRGIAVPESLSVVGYDDSPIAEQVWPALTTVRQDAVAMTDRAVEVLNQAVKDWRADRSARREEDVLLPYEIVLRASIARVRR